MMPPKVWILVPDNHTEGLGAPICAFWDKHQAEKVLRILNECALRSFVLVEVQTW